MCREHDGHARTYRTVEAATGRTTLPVLEKVAQLLRSSWADNGWLPYTAKVNSTWRSACTSAFLTYGLIVMGVGSWGGAWPLWCIWVSCAVNVPFCAAPVPCRGVGGRSMPGVFHGGTWECSMPGVSHAGSEPCRESCRESCGPPPPSPNIAAILEICWQQPPITATPPPWHN